MRRRNEEEGSQNLGTLAGIKNGAANDEICHLWEPWVSMALVVGSATNKPPPSEWVASLASLVRDESDPPLQ